MIPAIVLGLTPTGLGVVRSLGRGGVKVLALDTKRSAGASSRYCTAGVCADPDKNSEQFLAQLHAHLSELGGRAVVIPCSDAFTLAISRSRESLNEGLILRIPPSELLEALVDKKGTAEIARQAGVPIPSTLFIGSVSDAESHGDELSYPVFMKPRYGHLWREKLGNTSKGWLAGNKSQLIEKMRVVELHGLQVVAQEVIPGGDSNIRSWVGYFDQHSKLVAEFQFRKWRQHPPFFGIGTLTESVHDEQLGILGRRMLEGSGYIGPAWIEFKRHQQDGGLRLIEVNVRWGYQVDMAVKAGVDFPMINYLEATGMRVDKAPEWRNGVKWLDFSSDLITSAGYLRSGQLRLSEWVASFWRVRSHAYFDFWDPAPFLRQYAHLVLRTGQKIKDKVWRA